jgi:hypothetical protein
MDGFFMGNPRFPMMDFPIDSSHKAAITLPPGWQVPTCANGWIQKKIYPNPGF